LLGGAALWLLLPQAPSAWQRRLGLICAGAAAALGGLILLEYVLGRSLGIDQALAFRPITVAPNSVVPAGRPGPAAAANLLLAGLGLLALDPGVARRLPRLLAPAGLLFTLLL